jgi:hypothetical protein
MVQTFQYNNFSITGLAMEWKCQQGRSLSERLKNVSWQGLSIHTVRGKPWSGVADAETRHS